MVHELVVYSWLFTLPLEQSDHVASEDALENRSREVNIGAADIVKEVLQDSVVLKWNCDIDNQYKKNNINI